MALTAVVPTPHCTSTSIDPRSCGCKSCSDIAKLPGTAQTTSSQSHGDHRHGCQRGKCLLNAGVSSKSLVTAMAPGQQEVHCHRAAAIVKEQQRSTALKMCACAPCATGSGHKRNVECSSLGKLAAARRAWSEAAARAVRRAPRSSCPNAGH
ncbi:hypothetical protein TRVL_07539 [Trypanosoma vivax]|nr:hypothetical protein TRVL_07539 [Trypanosoma vivax]